MSKIALFAFGLAAVLVAGFAQADAASRRVGYRNYPSAITAGADNILLDRAKGYPQGY